MFWISVYWMRSKTKIDISMSCWWISKFNTDQGRLKVVIFICCGPTNYFVDSMANGLYSQMHANNVQNTLLMLVITSLENNPRHVRIRYMFTYFHIFYSNSFIILSLTHIPNFISYHLSTIGHFFTFVFISWDLLCTDHYKSFLQLS